MDHRRIRHANQEYRTNGPVLYWMHREFRTQDNWSLIHARLEALKHQVPVAVIFCLSPSFLDATLRQYDFLLRNLEQVHAALQNDNIGFILGLGEPVVVMHQLCRQYKPGLVVTDFDPLRIKRTWVDALLAHSRVAVDIVDARNIVPCWLASAHREVGARTLRPKIQRHLPSMLTPFPLLPPHPISWETPFPVPQFTQLSATLKVDRSVQPVHWLQPGEQAAMATLHLFLNSRLNKYDLRNDPNVDVCSNLSPYLHFGMIAAQRVALEVQSHAPQGEPTAAFLEELIIRRELADNFCLYTPQYDQVAGFPAWAQNSLEKHRQDKRPSLYDDEAFDLAQTHDPLWNSAQQQMKTTGKMHGYMRMYWAKKILEWTENAAEALRLAIFLNDRYSLDGRDSNGYAGIAWSIGGVHDRGWTERPVFGTIRYMNDRGAARKFDVKRYIQTWCPTQASLFPLPSG